MRKVLIMLAAVFSIVGFTASPAFAASSDHQVCDTKGNGDCLQGSGLGTIITYHSPNGAANQRYNFFQEAGECNNGFSTSNCPFPGAPVGKQVVVIGREASTSDSGLCGGWAHQAVNGTLVHCNGGSGTIFILDGFAVESGLVGRQTGGKAYLCTSGASAVQVFTTFVVNQCQWDNLSQ